MQNYLGSTYFLVFYIEDCTTYYISSHLFMLQQSTPCINMCESYEEIKYL